MTNNNSIYRGVGIYLQKQPKTGDKFFPLPKPHAQDVLTDIILEELDQEETVIELENMKTHLEIIKEYTGLQIDNYMNEINLRINRLKRPSEEIYCKSR